MSWHQIASFVTVFVNAIVQSCKRARGIARIPNIPLYFEHFLLAICYWCAEFRVFADTIVRYSK